MKRQDIFLNVTGEYVEDGEKSEVSFFTEGWLEKDGKKVIIEYDEGSMSGLDNIVTRLTVEGDKLLLRRIGGFETEFIFDQKKLFEAAYDTPYGYMQLSVLPLVVQSDISESDGIIDLEYVIKIQGQSSFNKLNINYKAKN
ncbi:MAG: DUF1934 domain-containing protein [Christensenellaceae bacterium]|jgi:uncharacterized beta-barrel protein YwiB (DUF1934 family)